MKKLLVILCLSALFLAGCGGGDDDGGSVDTAAEGSSKTDTEFSGKGGDDFCALAKKFEEDFEDTGDTSTSDDAEKEFKELASAIDELADEAPGEIEDDVRTIATALEEYTDLLAKYDYDFAKIPEDEAKDIDLQNPEVEEASNRVESYFEKVCKMDSDGDGDTDGVIEDDSSTTDDTSTEPLPEEEPADGTEDEQAPADETEATTGE